MIQRKFFLKYVFGFILTIFIIEAFLPHPEARAATEGKELFLIAQKAFDDGFYDVALRYIQDFLKEYPTSEKRLEANLLLGQCYFFKGQYLKAFEVFAELLKYTEFRDATLFWLGETYLKGNDYPQAEHHYRQVIDVYPDSIYTPQATYSLAWIFWEQKKYETAIGHFQKLISKFPSHVLNEDSSFKLGECAYNLAHYDQAIEYFRDYVLKFPQSNRHDQAYFYTAESYYYLDSFRSAISYYEKAAGISQDPKLIVLAKVGGGWSYLRVEEFEQSRKLFEEALALSQAKGIVSDDVYLGQASLFSEMNQEAEALKAYEQIIQNFPQSLRLCDAYLGKANILYALKDYPKAIAAYQTVIEKFSKTPEASAIVEKARFGLAWTYLKEGQVDSSIQSFQEIMDQTDNKIVKVSALTQIGDAYQDIGNLEKALDVYDRILRDYPDSLYTDYVQYRQAISLLKMDKIDGALLSLKTLTANFPQSKYLKEASYYLGLTYFKKGDWAAARQALEDFLKGAPKNHEFLAEANYVLALSLFNGRDYGGALKIFEQITKNFPDQGTLTRDAQLGVAKALYNLGDQKEAIKKIKIILYKYPKTISAQEALLWLGSHYLESSDFDSAILTYQQLIDEFPASEKVTVAHFEIAQAYEAKGLLDKALDHLRLIEAPLDKELTAKVQLAIADIFSQELDQEGAIEMYLKIAAGSAEFKRDAYVKIARIYEANQKYDKAVEAYQNALSSDLGFSEFKNAEIQFCIGDIYEILNQSDQAVATYLKIPYLYSQEVLWVTKAYLRVARIFEDKGDWENAKTTYQKVMDLGTDEVKFAQERLEWIRDNTPGSSEVKKN